VHSEGANENNKEGIVVQFAIHMPFYEAIEDREVIKIQHCTALAADNKKRCTHNSSGNMRTSKQTFPSVLNMFCAFPHCSWLKIVGVFVILCMP